MDELPLEIPVSGSYVRVVPEVSLDGLFDYAVPNALAGKIRPGHRVRVPWGRSQVFGYVVSCPVRPEVERCREVLGLAGEEPLIPETLLRLADWVQDYYCSDLATVLKSMMPKAVRSRADGFVERWWVEALEKEGSETTRLLARAEKQRKAHAHLNGGKGGWLAELIEETKLPHAVWRALEEKGLVSFRKERRERGGFVRPVQTSNELQLTDEQRLALEMWRAERRSGSPKPVLLQGVTGSGKTEVYLQAASEVLAEGGSVLVLVPEISLAPQTVRRVRGRFEEQGIGVAVWHSRLSDGERHDQWHRIARGEARMVIGARSAVFAPLHRLGLILVDEEHESSYKQEESPRYHARDVAVMRAALEKCTVLLGSATPSLESYHNARTGKYRQALLSKRVEEGRLPVVHVLDLRKEPDASKNLLAARLSEEVRARTARGEQALIFLNRRGFSTHVQCPNCGDVVECEHCAVPMTYHRAGQKMRCHFCEAAQPVVEACPKCGHRQLNYGGTGTQKIEERVEKLFSGLRWKRIDSDSMRGKGTFEDTMDELERGEIDLVIGTQMVAKGLHLPKVTCVGVVNVDGALNLPDFRSSEKVFQQLVQVAGRAGRGEQPGEVFVQTFTPFHPAIQSARHHDVEGFCEAELEFRKEMHYPPYCRAAMLTFRGRSEEKARYCAEEARRMLEGRLPEGSELSDAGPAPLPRLQEEFRYQIFIKTAGMPKLSRILKSVLSGVEWPEGIGLAVDIDPLNLL
jgi:primosomal protein N' (replication factor Y)